MRSDNKTPKEEKNGAITLLVSKKRGVFCDSSFVKKLGSAVDGHIGNMTLSALEAGLRAILGCLHIQYLLPYLYEAYIYISQVQIPHIIELYRKKKKKIISQVNLNIQKSVCIWSSRKKKRLGKKGLNIFPQVHHHSEYFDMTFPFPTEIMHWHFTLN